MAKFTGKPDERPIATSKPKRRRAPGKTIESRENQIISLAYDLVEERMRKKIATSQEIILFAKMGSSTAQLEKAKLEKEKELLEAKAENLKSQKRVEELYAEAMKSLRGYRGEEDDEDEED